MFLTADQRLQQNRTLRDFENWPVIRLEDIPAAKRRTYRRNLQAMQLVLKQVPYQQIREATGLHPAQIARLKQRALAGDDDSEPHLTTALIPGRRLARTKRRKPLPTTTENCGTACAFQALLEFVPGLKDKLDVMLKADLQDNPKGENLTPRAFHQRFLCFLDQAHHPQTQYPFTEDQLAYESCRLYFHSRREHLLRAQVRKRRPKRVVSPARSDSYFGREIQIDEYTFDAHCTLWLSGISGHVPFRVARFAVILVSDVDSTAILGFYLAFTQHCSQYDVLSALTAAGRFAEPQQSTVPGIDYLPGPAFPNQISPEIARVAWHRVALDNALSHCAESVAAYICEQHFGTLSLGTPRSPKLRHDIENAIRQISSMAKRFKSTSGKHAADPIRESRKNAKKPPMPTVEAVEEAIYALCCQANNTPKPHLMGETPLEAVRRSMMAHPLPLRPDDPDRVDSPFVLEQRLKIQWLKHEPSAPYLHFMYQRYHGQCLSGLLAKGAKAVVVHYDFRDIRSLTVYTLDGHYAGEVLAPMSWQKFPHGVKTRQSIQRVCRALKRKMKDPLVGYFNLQLKRANQSKAALEMCRLQREYLPRSCRLDPSNRASASFDDPAELAAQSDREVPPPRAPRASSRPSRPAAIPAWSTDLAYHQGGDPPDG